MKGNCTELWVDGDPVQETIFEQAENNKAIANCNGFVLFKPFPLKTEGFWES